MSTYVALICNLEQIWPYCDPKGTANGWVLVGINWSVSIGSDTPDGFKDIVGDPAGPGDFTAIEPWMWPEITAIQVLPNLNGTALCVPAVCPPRPCNPKLLSDKLDARLHAEFWNGREKAAALQFSPRQGPASDKLTYHNALADLSTRPAVIQQGLNLSRCFWIQAQENQHLFAAPVLAGDPFRASGVKLYPDANPPAPLPNDPLTYEWKYVNSASKGIEVRAYMRALEITFSPPNSGTMLSLGDLFVKVPPTQERNSPLEEAYTLARRAADLPQLLIEAAADFKDPSHPDYVLGDDSHFQNLVLSRLRDVLALRPETDPAARSIVRDALAQFAQTVSGDVKSARQTSRLGRFAKASKSAPTDLGAAAAAWVRQALQYGNRNTEMNVWILSLKSALTLGKNGVPGYELLVSRYNDIAPLPGPAPTRPRPSGLALLREIYQAFRDDAAWKEGGALRLLLAGEWNDAIHNAATSTISASQELSFFADVTPRDGDQYATAFAASSPFGVPEGTWIIEFPAVDLQSGSKYSFTLHGVQQDPPDLTFSVTFGNKTATVAWTDGAGDSVMVDLKKGPPHGFRFYLVVPDGTVFAQYLQNGTWHKVAHDEIDLSRRPAFVSADFSQGAVNFLLPHLLRCDTGSESAALAAWDAWFKALPSSGDMPGVDWLRTNVASETAGQLASAAMSPFWMWVGKQTKDLSRRFKEAFGSYVRALTDPSDSATSLPPSFIDHAPPAYASVGGLSSDQLFSLTYAALRSKVVDSAENLAPAPPKRYPSTAAPDPILLQVEHAGKLTGDDEIYRKISGFGVLMRRKPDGKWRCVTTARLVDYDRWVIREQLLAMGAPNVPPQIDYSPVTIVPMRMTFDKDGNRDVLLRYDAGPLVANDPLACLARNTDYSGNPATCAYSPDTSPIFFYESVDQSVSLACAVTPKELGMLPALKWGRSYEVILFAIPNSGVLPKLLTAAYTHDSPGCTAGQPCSSNVQPFTFNQVPEGGVTGSVMQIAYYRTVPVGPPSLEAAEGDQITFPGPPEKSDVVPLEREMERDVIIGKGGGYNVYFATDAGGGGALNLDHSGWSLSLEGISLEIGDRFKLQLRTADGTDTFAIDVSRTDQQTATLTYLGQALPASLNPGDRYFDLKIESAKNALSLRFFSRRYLFSDNGVNRILLYNPPGTIPPVSSAHLRVSAVSLASPLTYRRPRVVLGNGSVPSRSAGVLPLAVLGSSLQVPASFSFKVERPKTDVDTWDYWVRWQPGQMDHRARLIAEHKGQYPDRPVGDKTPLADPAVTGILIEAVPLWKGKPDPTLTKFYPMPDDPFADPRDNEIKVTVGVQGSFDPAQANYPLPLLPGQIWEIRIYSAVDQRNFTDYSGADHLPEPPFDATWNDGELKYTDKVTGKTYFLLSDCRVRVETAISLTDLMTGDQLQAVSANLLAGLIPAYDSDGPNQAARAVGQRDELALSLRRDPGDSDAFWPLARAVETHLQQWEWMGRPESPEVPFPFSVNPGTDFSWDKIGFYGRGSDDVFREPGSVSLYDSRPVVYREDIAHDPKLLYIRYALRVFSRYRGIGDASEVRTEVDNWRRELVKCRIAERPHVPNVRFVMPLLTSEEPDPGKDLRDPGILVILDEPWYASAGLAEKLKVEIVLVKDEELRDEPSGIVQEISGDQTRNATAFPPDFHVDIDPADIVGPIGHTTQPELANPRFGATSFMVRLPKSVEAMQLEWPHVKLRFQRYLEAAGVADGVPYRFRTSDWSTAHWVRFVPDGTNYPTTLAEPSFHRMSPLSWKLLDTEFRSLGIFLGQRPDPIVFHPNGRRTFAAVVTATIQDAFGRPQERYVGTYLVKTTGDQMPQNESVFYGYHSRKFASQEHLQLRLVELQTNPGAKFRPEDLWADNSADPPPPPGGVLWTESSSPVGVKFPEAANVTARIVRVSRRIPYAAVTPKRP